MKAFERYNETQGIDFRVRFSSPAQYKTYTEQERENAWRAALELVESWLDYSTEHKEIKDKIHDELEGGD